MRRTKTPFSLPYTRARRRSHVPLTTNDPWEATWRYPAVKQRVCARYDAFVESIMKQTSTARHSCIRFVDSSSTRRLSRTCTRRYRRNTFRCIAFAAWLQSSAVARARWSDDRCESSCATAGKIKNTRLERVNIGRVRACVLELQGSDARLYCRAAIIVVKASSSAASS